MWFRSKLEDNYDVKNIFETCKYFWVEKNILMINLRLVLLLELRGSPQPPGEEGGRGGEDEDLHAALQQQRAYEAECLVEPRALAELVRLEVLVRVAAEAAVTVSILSSHI